MICSVIALVAMCDRDQCSVINIALHNKHYATISDKEIGEMQAGFLYLASMNTVNLRKAIIQYLEEGSKIPYKPKTKEYWDAVDMMRIREYDVGVLNRLAVTNSNLILKDQWFGPCEPLDQSRVWTASRTGSDIVLQPLRAPILITGASYNSLGEFDYLAKHATRRKIP